MHINWKFVLTILAILLTTLACSLSGKGGNNPTRPVSATRTPRIAAAQLPPAIETQSSAPSLPTDSGWAKRGDAAVWPDYIPDDIPELEGKIRLVMLAPQSHVRIFYEDMTTERIDQYLRLLEEQGYHLEYIVYVREGFPDNSKERLKKGDYDAVDITRGDYHMNIGYADGSISYDVYISGFEIPAESENLPPAFSAPTSEPAAPVFTWPADLEGIVPQPQGCRLSSVIKIDNGSYSIVCDGEGDQIRLDYIALLLSEGFVETNRMESQTGELLSAHYEKGSLQVVLLLGQYPGIVLSISGNP